MVDKRRVGVLYIAESSCVFPLLNTLTPINCFPLVKRSVGKEIAYLWRISYPFDLLFLVTSFNTSFSPLYIYKVVACSFWNNPLTSPGWLCFFFFFFCSWGCVCVIGRKALRELCQLGWENLRPFHVSPAFTCEFPELALPCTQHVAHIDHILSELT